MELQLKAPIRENISTGYLLTSPVDDALSQLHDERDECTDGCLPQCLDKARLCSWTIAAGRARGAMWQAQALRSTGGPPQKLSNFCREDSWSPSLFLWFLCFFLSSFLSFFRLFSLSLSLQAFRFCWIQAQSHSYLATLKWRVIAGTGTPGNMESACSCVLQPLCLGSRLLGAFR